MHRMIRTAAIAPLAAVLLVGGLSGCHWFKKKNALYTQSGEARPLEVPPDLDRPSAERAMELPAVKGTSAAAAAPAVAATGFAAAGDRDAVFAKVGEALASINGVKVVNKADILGTYDIDYLDAKFLIRVTKAGDGAYVAAVDPRGLAPSGDAAGKLIAALKAVVAP
ncbi:MAG: hypothetical protein KUL77_07300 [Thermomonas sp.]|uniref:hypothetical protein n=1 Tax=Thermomonas sp. TaxID=1971895 RepID=UPI001EC2E7F8|nr:hypothetical protein [Thermomonas sp.]MBV2209354.1 hypothetical protein [Thermomonas sp.]